ncbi:MAG: ubiquinol-cytochrome c reductase iron-sulfur subunit [Chloracidobacterium sp.]|nr:ubiquinol-cytochrome c reductase iron-sulfur subunit [Chloracidobacterium sp.]
MTTKPGKEKSRFDPEPIARRDFIGLAAIGTTAVTFLFSIFGMLKLPKAAVSASPAKKFNVTLPASLANGEAFTPPGRSVAVFRDDDGVFAISTVCTHLGCIVKPSPTGFNCPCHGSAYTTDGLVTKGPAPKALPWLKVTKSGSGYVVDEEAMVKTGTKV